MVDVLHCVDLGVAAHVIGNILVLCIAKKVLGGKNIDENTTLLAEDLEAWQKKSIKKNTRMQGKLTWQRLKTSGGFPKLKAKAAATRHLAAYAYDLAKQHLKDDPRIVGVAQTLLEFYSVLETEGLHMRDTAIDKIKEVGFQCCILYAALANESATANKKYWKMSPKWHLFLHLCEWAIPDTGLNPRSYWTYADEDIVGNLIEVAEGCHPATMAVVALTKWVLLAFE